MQTIINACRQIVSVAIEIRNMPGVDLVKADSMYLRLFAAKQMLESYKGQPAEAAGHLSDEEKLLIAKGRRAEQAELEIEEEISRLNPLSDPERNEWFVQQLADAEINGLLKALGKLKEQEVKA